MPRMPFPLRLFCEQSRHSQGVCEFSMTPTDRMMYEFKNNLLPYDLYEISYYLCIVRFKDICAPDWPG